MNSSESLAKLYEIFFELMGPTEAQRVVRTAMSNVLHEIQEEQLPITAEILDQKLNNYAQDFVEVYEKNKASVA